MSALNKSHASAHALSAATVNVRVRDLAQMFNSLDASPFWDRDLDVDAADFIEEEFRQNRAAAQWHLHVHASEGADLAADLQPALEHYYTRMAHSTALRLREQLRLGEFALLGGLVIFLLSMSARGILSSVASHALSRLLDEGLIILAWLALWRPVETLVYGWVPLYRQRRLYQRLAAIRVTVRMEHAHPAAASVAAHRQDGESVAARSAPDASQGS
ncbi:MAG: hypothetical protein ACP5P4_00585 [Steroidobacteraceae bacterium]